MRYLSLPSGTVLAIDGLEVVNTDKLEIETMKTTLYRFMSNVEHTLLVAGRNIVNHTDHGACRGENSTTSRGFCFGFGDKDQAVRDSRFLKGIVTMQWLMVVEIDTDRMRIGQGLYVSSYDSRGYAKGYGLRKEMYTESMNVGMFDNVRFYPVMGISEKFVPKCGLRTVIVGCHVVTKRERILLKFCNEVAHAEANKLSYFDSGDCRDTTGDFTRKPWEDVPEVHQNEGIDHDGI